MTTGGDGEDGDVDVLTGRSAVLRRLTETTAHVRDLVDDLDQSRSTVNRAINELEGRDLVERADDGYGATLAGRFALEELDAFRGALGDVVGAHPVTAPLPVDADLDRRAVVGGEARLATDPNPYRPLERFHAALEDATRYRALLPALDDPRHVRLLYEHVVTDGRPAELVASASLFAALRAEFPRRTAAMTEAGRFDLRAGDVPPYVLALVDEPDGTAAGEEDGTTALYVVVFNDSGGVHGVVENRSDRALRWAERQYARVRDDAEDRTAEVHPDADGGRSTTVDGGVARSALGQSVSVALEREGFVRLDRAYFREEPVADPTTAWRAGLTIPEVHTGYAVEREVSGQPATDAPGDRRDGGALAATLTDDLTDGGDCVVLGPPASGKSTVCKQVACDWYEADRGPVLYRERGRGRAFASVDDLEVTVDAAPGHALVVVEDAARGEAEAALDAVQRFRDRADVSVLLDAREGEWRDAVGESTAAADLAVHHVPPLSDGAWERLVEHFERTVDEPVEVPLERLREEVRAETVGDDDAVRGEVGLALHRLSRYADPLADGRTSMEAAVAAVHDDLAGDGLAMDVCVLANVLNAAGVSVEADALYAVADPADYDAVDAAISRLEGRVLFARTDGTYRVVHETWSTAFLAHHVDAAGETAAAERFRDCLEALLSLADDPGRCEAVAAHRGTEWPLPAVRDDSAGWADGVVTALFDLGQRRPKLAPLFGDGTHDGLALPDACSERVAARRPLWLGRMFVGGGYFDRALAAADRGLEAVPEDAPTACRLLGVRADALAGTSEFDDAAAAARRQRRLADALDAEAADEDARELAAEALQRLGDVATERGDYDEAVAHVEESLAVARAVGARHLVADGLETLGTVAVKRGDPEGASEHFEESLAIGRDLGDRRAEVATLTSLGSAAYEQADYERAREYHRESLAVARAVGDRAGEATTLGNLGQVAHEQGDHVDARDYHEQALAIERAIGNREGVANRLGNLGLVARMQGDFDAARDYHEESLAIARDIGDREGEAAGLSNLGAVAGRQDEHDAAREYFERSLAITRELGHRRGEAATLDNLGVIARAVGEYDDAREYVEAALAIRRETGNPRGEANCLETLGLVAAEQGYHAAARDHHEQSLTIRRELGEPRRIASSLANLGAAVSELGDQAAAREHHEEALALKEEHDHEQAVAQSTFDLAVVDRREGDHATAADRLERAQSLYDEGGKPAGVAKVRLERGRLALERSDVDAARDHAGQAREAFEAVGEPHQVARARSLAGRVADAEGDREAAREHWRAAVETFDDVGAVGDALGTLEHLVAACRDAGDDDAVERWCGRAAEYLADAPDHLADEHRHWVEGCRGGE